MVDSIQFPGFGAVELAPDLLPTICYAIGVLSGLAIFPYVMARAGLGFKTLKKQKPGFWQRTFGDAKNAVAVNAGSVDFQKIKTAEITVPVIAEDVLVYQGGELGSAYPDTTRLYYSAEALRDPEYLETVLRSPLQVQTHEKNTGEFNRDVDGWPIAAEWDETEKRVKVRGILHGEENVRYAEENKNKPNFGTSAYISFLEIDRTPGIAPNGKPYDAVVRKAVNNHIAILPNIRDPKNVILAMNAVKEDESKLKDRLSDLHSKKDQMNRTLQATPDDERAKTALRNIISEIRSIEKKLGTTVYNEKDDVGPVRRSGVARSVSRRYTDAEIEAAAKKAGEDDLKGKSYEEKLKALGLKNSEDEDEDEDMKETKNSAAVRVTVRQSGGFPDTIQVSDAGQRSSYAVDAYEVKLLDGPGFPGFADLPIVKETVRRKRQEDAERERIEKRSARGYNSDEKQEIKNMDYEEFKGHMNSYEKEKDSENQLVEKVANAVLAKMNAKNEDEPAKDKPAEEKKEAANEDKPAEEKKEEAANEEKKEEAANALPSDVMVKDFSDALGITFKKAPTLRELAALVLPEAANASPAELITALNAKRETLRKPSAVNSAGATGAASIDELLKSM